MQLINAITEELQSFKEICTHMGMKAPTPELRLEMAKLISSKKVEQVGQKRGAKYRLIGEKASEEKASEEKASEEKASEEKASEEKASEEKASEEKKAPAIRKKTVFSESWEWVDHTKYRFVQWEPQTNTPLHEWLLENWRQIAEKPFDILTLGIRTSRIAGCPSKLPVVVCNAICELAQLGKISVRAYRSSDGITQNFYGAWVDSTL